MNTERNYAPNYRSWLAELEGRVVKVSGVISRIVLHDKRPDLTNVLIENLKIVHFDRVVEGDHIWILRRQLVKVGVQTIPGSVVNFTGLVYIYQRLGGKSIYRNLLGHHDFSILPIDTQSHR